MTMQSVSGTSGEKPVRRNLPFQLSCWVLAMVAFAQLLIAGVALAARVEAAQEVRVEVKEKIVTKIVEVGTRPSREKPAEIVVALPPSTRPAETELPEATPLDAPPIADPVVEKLFREARDARVAEDMGRAIVKLESARKKAPNEPNVLYELGLVYETMAGYDADPDLVNKAAGAFQQVFELGTTGAGALYKLAAGKLRDGISRPSDMQGKLALGQPKLFRDDAHPAGERIVLTIPVRTATGNHVDADDFFVQVQFYDETSNGEKLPAGPSSISKYEWTTGEIDWLGGEETLQVSYVIPAQSGPDAHLLGRRSYYGQVVELLYKNELIDTRATPRHLAGIEKFNNRAVEQPWFGDLPPLDAGLLPPMEDEMLLPEPGFPD